MPDPPLSCLLAILPKSDTRALDTNVAFLLPLLTNYYQFTDQVFLFFTFLLKPLIAVSHFHLLREVSTYRLSTGQTQAEHHTEEAEVTAFACSTQSHWNNQHPLPWTPLNSSQ